jgi:hypothetical protein
MKGMNSVHKRNFSRVSLARRRLTYGTHGLEAEEAQIDSF